ncbi:MAG: hypothetical protein JXL97_12320 [Bacteroidales bacterium]|nr:hypothetical protein [Bacteroidales bacterium]
MKQILFFVTILLSINSLAQDKTSSIYFQFSDKSVTLYPFYKTFSVGFAPALTFGAEKDFFVKNNYTFFYASDYTFYKHNMIGNGHSINLNIGYKNNILNNLYIDCMSGINLISFFTAREDLSLNENGEYEKTNPVHFNFGININLGIGYQINRCAIFSQYSYMLQGKYNNILPILPTSLLSIGLKYQLKTKTAAIN